MKQEHVNMMQELLTEERKMERLNLTRREFAEFELELIRACEKQLPGKILRMKGNPLILDCPICGVSLYNNKDDEHCYNCGQLIDWSEE